MRQLRHYYPSQAAAREAAQAELDKRVRGQQRLNLSLVGDPAYCAEAPLTLFQWVMDGLTYRLGGGRSIH